MHSCPFQERQIESTLINKRSSGIRPHADDPIKFRSNRFGYATEVTRSLIIIVARFSNEMDTENNTSAAGCAAARKFVGDPGVAVRVGLLREFLWHAVLVMHTDIVILVQ